MRPKEAASAAAVARTLRAEILAGDYDAKGRVPSRSDLHERFKISLENASVVLRMLSAEGWVTLEQGRGSFILPRRSYSVAVKIPRSRASVHAARLQAALAESTAKEAAVRGDLDWEVSGRELRISMRVEAADAPRAAAIAYEVTVSADSAGWDWDGWDLAGASVTASPA